MDLRGLAALFAKINSLLAAPAAELEEIDSLDLFGLSRFLERRGESDRARVACAQALEIGLPAEFRPRARRDLAMLAKRRGDYAQAAALWHELLSDPNDGIFACQQLAIHFERWAKDFGRAADFARLGLAKLQSALSHTRNPLEAHQAVRLVENFQKRITRLEKKVAVGKSVAQGGFLPRTARANAG
jgi:Flp pilus assembly protein TadD